MNKQTMLSLAVVVLGAITFWASAVQKMHKTVSTYATISDRKTSKTTTHSYELPVVTSLDNIPQEQIKGGVTISCEVIPFRITEHTVTDSVPFYRSPIKQGIDVMEVSHRREYTIAPDNVQFKIRIKNNQERVLKLHECAIVVIIDGVQYSLDQNVTTAWENTLIVSGFEKELFIEGPDITTLRTMKVIDIFINDVPTAYNQAGVVQKKNNFEWLFGLSLNTISQEQVIDYTYVEIPVKQERCVVCSGVGYSTSIQSCYNCGGSGRTQNMFDGKYYTCSRCSGAGKINVKTDCSNCEGKGVRMLYRSPLPPLTNSVTWTGWKVKVNSNPPGARVKIADISGKYVQAGFTNTTVEWYSPPSQQYPILVSYGDTTIKVLPFDAKGRETETIEIDFTKGIPKVKQGRVVQ